MDDIKVHILKRKGRDNFSMRYLDPFTLEAESLASSWVAQRSSNSDSIHVALIRLVILCDKFWCDLGTSRGITFC